MNLVTVNMTVDPKTGGGTAVRALHVTRSMADLGVRCAIVTTTDGLDGLNVDLRGIDVVTLRAIGGRFRVPIAGLGVLADAIARADVVLIMNHWTLINVLAYRAAMRAGTPYVLTPGGAVPAFGRSRALKRLYDAAYGRRIIRDAASLVATTPTEARTFAVYGIDAADVAVIPNATRVSDGPGDGARFRARFGVGPGPILLYVGRLAPIKGPDLAVEAFARAARELPDWRLVMAGPDEGMETRLRRAAAAAGVGDRVHFVGFIGEAARSDAFAAAELLVVPSRREAMSHVATEAAMAGLPVIVTDQCGLPEVETSGSGWVVPPTVERLAAAIREACRDRAALAPRGDRWRAYAASHFSMAHVARLHLDLFQRVARPAGSR